MSHQPPVPEAATSPYPLHPAPGETAQLRQPERSPLRRPSSPFGVSGGAFGIGVALGLGALVSIGSVFLARRRHVSAAKPRVADNKSKRGPSDRRQVASSEPYEVTYFARKHRISASDARAIIKEAGSDRKAANALAAKRAAGAAKR